MERIQMTWQAAVSALLLVLLLWLLLSNRRPVFPLDDRVVLVTGAGSGIGRRLAETIASRAKRVTLVLIDIDQRALDAVRSSLQSSGCDVRAYQCDVADDSAVDECVKQVMQQIAPKRIDVLVNNAGVVAGRPLLELSPAQIRKTFAVNTLAHFWMVRAVLPSMKKDDTRDAMIVSVSSVVGFTSSAGLSDYCASKAATNAFHESLRLELQRDRVTHIRTLLVCPSGVDTGMFDGAFQGDSWSLKLTRALIPLLEEQDVVDCIFSAILGGKKLLIYCSRGWRGSVFPWMLPVSRLLPVPVYDLVMSLAGGLHGMDSFVGRAKKQKQG